MFSQYLLPVKTATLIFPVLAVVLLLPFSFVAYRRRGRLGWQRSLAFFGFAYWAAAAFLLTLMPLPRNRQAVCAAYPADRHPQYAPGHFVADFVKEMHGRHGLAAVLDNPALYQTTLNVAMLVPLGLFLRYYGGRSLAVTTAAGLGTSLLFELTQGTGVWGLYPCPYRLADVDDLLLNTTGAALGWLLAGRLLRYLPDLRLADERARRRRDVVFGRRLWAYTLDAAGVVLVSALAGLVCLGVRNEYALFLVPPAVTAGWFVGLSALGNGSTPGKRLMRVTLVDRDGAAPDVGALLRRYAPLVAVSALPDLALVAGVPVLAASVLAVLLSVVATLVVLARRSSGGLRYACRADAVRRPVPARHRIDWRRVPVSG